jgi:hypothetical protein
MTITMEGAAEILGAVTDEQIDQWTALLRNPVGFHQCHGFWTDSIDPDEPAECCLTVFAKRVEGVPIDANGNVEDSSADWEEIAESHFDQLRFNVTPFIGRNDNIEPFLTRPGEVKFDERGQSRPWTYAEIADYLDELKEARRGQHT